MYRTLCSIHFVDLACINLTRPSNIWQMFLQYSVNFCLAKVVSFWGMLCIFKYCSVESISHVVVW
ncbi:hypothetical protein Hamer_G011123 [Homarus americanus]|uniref:Uncharacterized protein n=1 Tax=Homarus americanus TaxID=6706 RepID=A0A8J5MX78_HOMAM|nr:hypothetical protein Hamer_G011123 [Homarus americanus]